MHAASLEPPVRTAPITDRSAWRAADFAADRSWIVHWSKDDLAEIDAALRTAQQRGLTAVTVTRDGFPLPTLGARLQALRHEIEYGRGFVLLRGLPMRDYGDDEAGLVFRGLGCHIGEAVTQNAKGDLLGHVRDQGYADYRGRSDVRGYQTRARLEFHTDVVDIVGLLCLRAAREGGHSLIVSSTTVHNEILRAAPQLLGLLYGNFLFDRRGEEVAGQEPYFVSPIYSLYKGYLSCRPAVIEYILSAEPKTGIPLSPAQRAALDAFIGEALRPDLQLGMDLEPGDIQLLNNSVILHARTGFIDHEEPEKRRHLLRLWLNVEGGRPVDPAAYPYRRGVPVGRARSAAHNQ
ncbi:MAG TPA: TauD/TfdA family dioxygenase [Stellaceae bacterium]|nr:TauD/TfdA family dioxygenase [Stellaceae bacterium]